MGGVRGLAQHRVRPLQFLRQAIGAWQWPSLQDIHHCPKHFDDDLCGYMHIVWQKEQGLHFPALSFIQVQFHPEHKGQLVGEGQVGQEVWPYSGNPFQMRGLTLGADTLSGGAVISASTEIPAFITASAGVPALGGCPALAPSFGETLPLFALRSFRWASLCVLTGATSAGFLHLALLGFILSYVWPHLTKVPPTPPRLISQAVKVNLLWQGNTLLNISFQVGQGTQRQPQVLGHFWWQRHLSWGGVRKQQQHHCYGHFSVHTLLSASLSLYSIGQTRSVWGWGRGFSYLICLYHAQDGGFLILLSLFGLSSLILHFDDLLLLYNNIGAGGLWHWLCCGWHPGGCWLCCRCWGLWWLAHYCHSSIHCQSFVGMGVIWE